MVRRSKDSRKGARAVALYGLLIALAFIFSYVEAMIPVPVPIPGVKLGLANLVNVVGLYTVGAAGTAAVAGIYLQQSGKYDVCTGRRNLQPGGDDCSKEIQMVQ